MNVNLFGIIGVTDIEILGVIKSISARRNKDRNEICLALSLMNQNIQSWYSHFNHIFSSEIAKQLSGKTFEETREVSDKVIKFVNRNESILRANESIDYCVDIATDYKVRHKKEVRGIDSEKAERIANRISYFRDTAVGVKVKWLRESLQKRTWDMSPEDIFNTLRTLESISEEIQSLTSSMRREIECDSESNKRLYLEIRKEISQL